MLYSWLTEKWYICCLQEALLSGVPQSQEACWSHHQPLLNGKVDCSCLHSNDSCWNPIPTLISLHSQMRSTGIPELTCVEDTDYIRTVLMLSEQEHEAERHFEQKVIKKCLDLGWTVQVMWWIHLRRKRASWKLCITDIHNVFASDTSWLLFINPWSCLIYQF